MSGEDKYRLFLNGDEDAFDRIMCEYFDGLIFFINRYVNDPHTAEDIAIDVFAYIAENRRKYNFKVSLKTYIYMIGKSRAQPYKAPQKARRRGITRIYIGRRFITRKRVFKKRTGAHFKRRIIKSAARYAGGGAFGLL